MIATFREFIPVQVVVDTKLSDILGVKPDASDRDLKKAFQEMARKYHAGKCTDPDATEKFQQVNEACEILKDPQRRQTYDRFGVQGLREGGGDFFGGGFFGGGGGRGRRTSHIGSFCRSRICTTGRRSR
jgi:DnaJ-class molecular chaperone